MAAVQEIEDFYGVYLLVSKNPNPKLAGRTYVGYTVDPNRRIKQHNGGQDSGGAKRTSNRGPWVMVMIVHGFPNNISALRFEWAWQQPKVSRRLKQIPALQKKLRKESNFEYHFRILTEMLQVGPWNRLPLTVRWLADEFHREFEVGKAPPMHMPICFGRVKKVPKKGKTAAAKKPRERRDARRRRDPSTKTTNAKSKGITVNYDYDVDDEYDLLVMKAAEHHRQGPAEHHQGSSSTVENVLSQHQQVDDDGDIIISSSGDDGDDHEEATRQQNHAAEEEPPCVICNGPLRRGQDFALRCLQQRPQSCPLICHAECLAGRCLEPGQYVPVAGRCPICGCSFLWGDLIRKANGCSDLVEEDADADAASTDAALFEVNDVSSSAGSDGE